LDVATAATASDTTSTSFGDTFTTSSTTASCSSPATTATNTAKDTELAAIRRVKLRTNYEIPIIKQWIANGPPPSMAHDWDERIKQANFLVENGFKKGARAPGQIDRRIDHGYGLYVLSHE
jgi:hypothetical protein